MIYLEIIVKKLFDLYRVLEGHTGKRKVFFDFKEMLLSNVTLIILSSVVIQSKRLRKRLLN